MGMPSVRQPKPYKVQQPEPSAQDVYVNGERKQLPKSTYDFLTGKKDG